MVSLYDKKLYRSSGDKVFGGVAGGLAEYFEIDSVIVRLLFVVVALLGAVIPIIILYLAMMFIVPKKSGHKNSDRVKEFMGDIKDGASHVAEDVGVNNGLFSSNKKIVGFLLVVVGLIILLDHFYPLYWLTAELIWPVLFILAGLYFIRKNKKNK